MPSLPGDPDDELRGASCPSQCCHAVEIVQRRRCAPGGSRGCAGEPWGGCPERRRIARLPALSRRGSSRRRSYRICSRPWRRDYTTNPPAQASPRPPPPGPRSRCGARRGPAWPPPRRRRRRLSRSLVGPAAFRAHPERHAASRLRRGAPWRPGARDRSRSYSVCSAPGSSSDRAQAERAKPLQRRGERRARSPPPAPPAACSAWPPPGRCGASGPGAAAGVLAGRAGRTGRLDQEDEAGARLGALLDGPVQGRRAGEGLDESDRDPVAGSRGRPFEPVGPAARCTAPAGPAGSTVAA